jgi:hypothetical protein
VTSYNGEAMSDHIPRFEAMSGFAPPLFNALSKDFVMPMHKKP